MTTNFEKVVDFNVKFGVPVFEKPFVDIFDKNPKLLELRMNLIREEMKELETAVKSKDYIEMVDALSDILYVVYGAGASIGMNLDKAFQLVHDSNMSKLCKNEEEAKKTVEYYKEKYLSGELPYDSAAYRLSEDKKYYVVFNKNTGKILKSINYNMVDLKPLVNIADNTANVGNATKN